MTVKKMNIYINKELSEKLYKADIKDIPKYIHEAIKEKLEKEKSE